MANWQMKIDFSPAKVKYRSGEITINELSKVVVAALKTNVKKAMWIDAEMGQELEDDIIPLFEEVADFDTCDVEDFDNALENLYDWADTPLDDRFGGKKMCWIAP